MARFFYLHFFLFVIALSTALAQDRKPDIIVTFTNQKLEVFITEVSKDIVKYRKASNADGPVFSVEKSTISSILYANGEVETFSPPADPYFDKQKPQEELYIPTPAPSTGSASDRRLQSLTTAQLQKNYNLYLKKTSTYRTMALVGGSVGVLFTAVGAVIISDANKNYYSSSAVYDDRLAGGVLLVMAGLGAGIPLTVVGLTKSKSYTKKTLKVRDELQRRNERLHSLRLSPGFNPASQTGYLTLTMSF